MPEEPADANADQQRERHAPGHHRPNWPSRPTAECSFALYGAREEFESNRIAKIVPIRLRNGLPIHCELISHSRNRPELRCAYCTRIQMRQSLFREISRRKAITFQRIYKFFRFKMPKHKILFPTVFYKFSKLFQ